MKNLTIETIEVKHIRNLTGGKYAVLNMQKTNTVVAFECCSQQAATSCLKNLKLNGLNARKNSIDKKQIIINL